MNMNTINFRTKYVLITLLILTGIFCTGAASPTSLIRISVSFAGDTTLGWDERRSPGNSFPEVFAQAERAGECPYEYFFANVRHIFEQDDIAFVNLEGPLTNRREHRDRTFIFRGPPEYAKILSKGGVTLAGLVNNHTLDFFQAGLLDTMQALEDEGIGFFADDFPYMEYINGVTIGFLGYNGWNLSNMNRISRDIPALKERGADIVVVSFHWGTEYAYYPTQTQQTLGRHAIASGADLVIGHHPHVIQGIEVYRDRFIVYSLGNFCFGGNRNPPDHDTFIYRHVFFFEQLETGEIVRREDLDQAYIIPCSISSVRGRNNFQPTPLTGGDAMRLFSRMAEYSRDLGTQGPLDIFDKLSGLILPIPID